MLSGWSGEKGISSPVLSRPGFVMERESQRGHCESALHGAAIVGAFWTHLKGKPGIWPSLGLLEITGELPFNGL